VIECDFEAGGGVGQTRLWKRFGNQGYSPTIYAARIDGVQPATPYAYPRRGPE
jgi:hypothetical protein